MDFLSWPRPVRDFFVHEIGVQGWQRDFPPSVESEKTLAALQSDPALREIQVISTSLEHAQSLRRCSHPELGLRIRHHVPEDELDSSAQHYWRAHWARGRGVGTLRCSSKPRHIKANFLVKHANARHHPLLRRLLRKPTMANLHVNDE